MECFRLEILPGQQVVGRTADGQWTAIQPGEYVVHRLKPKVASYSDILRFVGADDRGRDVHLPIDALPMALRAACPTYAAAPDLDRQPAADHPAIQPRAECVDC